MKQSDILGRLSILIIGSDNFDDDYFETLNGVENDLKLIDDILFNDSNALYSGIKPTILINPATPEIRNFLTEYVYSRSAEQDILLIYYSGHGTVVNGHQFGFVCKDTKIYSINDNIIPSTIITSSEIFDTLKIANVIPILIIDACHSGLIIPHPSFYPIQSVIDSMRDNIHGLFASDFMLFCACAEQEVTSETSLGGYFSRNIADVLRIGDKNNKRKPHLTINDIYKNIINQKLSNPKLGVEPRLYYGYGISDFPLFKNNAYEPITIRMDNYKLRILEMLWNDGNPISLTISELDNKLGKGAYANNSKLTYDPWNLAKKRKGLIFLTKKGEEFLQNKLKISEIIYKDATTEEKYISDPNSKMKSYYQFRAQPDLFDPKIYKE